MSSSAATDARLEPALLGELAPYLKRVREQPELIFEPSTQVDR